MADKGINNIKKIHLISFLPLSFGAFFLTLIVGFIVIPILMLVKSQLILILIAGIGLLMGIFFDYHMRKLHHLTYHHHLIFVMVVFLAILINMFILFYAKMVFYYSSYIPQKPEVVFGIYFIFFILPYLVSLEKGRHILQPKNVKKVHGILGIKF